MKTEKLHIKNFGGLEELDIELAQINVLIGPQASGKSICAKLCYFFKEIVSDLLVDLANEVVKADIKRDDEDTFLKYFPPSAWGAGPFEIRYTCGRLWIAVKRFTHEQFSVSISYSRYFDTLINDGLEAVKDAKAAGPSESEKAMGAFRFSFGKVYNAVWWRLGEEIAPVLTNLNTFIPAGRSFFAAIQKSIFAVIARDGTIDPFLVNFGRSYQRITRELKEKTGGRSSNKAVEDHVLRLMGGTYLYVKGDEFIKMEDGRRIPIEYASSGQQESLPLALTLAGIAQTTEHTWCTLIIEEPEAHLYPTAQRDIVHLIALVAGLASEDNGSQYFITTHSPYILSALNNLMYGGKISKDRPEKKTQVSELLGGAILDPSRVHAYALGDGTARSIIDSETGLVDAEVLDSVSGDLAREFEALVDMDFEEQSA